MFKKFIESLLLIIIISESYTLINRIKTKPIIDLTQGDLTIMFSVHVPLAIIVTICLIPISILYITKTTHKIKNISFLLLNISIITLISGIIWGQAIWGNFFIVDKKILDIILIICYYYIITYNNKLNIITIITITTLYYFIKISIGDINSIHQNIKTKSEFYNSIPSTYGDMILNNITIATALGTLYLITT